MRGWRFARNWSAGMPSFRRRWTIVAAREEEIARQNEELRSQTEELERQGEELRVTNEELARREKMLEALLDLARSLRADLPRNETMSRICEGLGRLVGGGASAILQKKGNEVAVVCHHGFGPEGLAKDAIPYERSFARWILEPRANWIPGGSLTAPGYRDPTAAGWSEASVDPRVAADGRGQSIRIARNLRQGKARLVR